VRIGCIKALGLSGFLPLLLSCTHLLIVDFLGDCLCQWTHLNLREALKSLCRVIDLILLSFYFFISHGSWKIGLIS
jgi:hypothetical protein